MTWVKFKTTNDTKPHFFCIGFITSANTLRSSVAGIMAAHFFSAEQAERSTCYCLEPKVLMVYKVWKENLEKGAEKSIKTRREPVLLFLQGKEFDSWLSYIY